MTNSQEEKPSAHGFLVMGNENLFASHLPMFFTPEHAYQAILNFEFPSNDMQTYHQTKKENPGKPLIILNKNSMILKDMVNSTSFLAKAHFANDNGDPIGQPFIKTTTVTVKKSLLFEQLNPNQEYPEKLTYYLYGTNLEFHLSHMLTKAPNFEQDLDVALSGDILDKINNSNVAIVKVSFPSLNEKSAQPITKDPLIQPEYSIIMEDGTNGNISIKNKFWINNEPLNMDMPGMNM